MIKVLNIPRYIYNEFRNDFLSCHPERSSMHMHVSNKCITGYLLKSDLLPQKTGRSISLVTVALICIN